MASNSFIQQPNESSGYRRIASVKNTPPKYPDSGLTESSIRWLIFNAKENGFERCIVRIGRRVFIDLDRFEDFMDQQALAGGYL